jgi:hypothetical protein
LSNAIEVEAKYNNLSKKEKEKKKAAERQEPRCSILSKKLDLYLRT